MKTTLNNTTSFPLWLKHHRKELDLTQRDLAKRIGCAVVTIKKIEAGLLRPSKELAELVAASFGVPAGQRAAFVEFARGKAPASQEARSRDEAPWQSIRDRPNNLPAPLNAFIGRQAEVTEASSLLRTSGVRLLTVSGPPGIGKTRLALQVATDLLPDFEGGVYFVPIAPVTDPALVVPTIAGALGVRESGGQPMLESLIAHLRDKQMLLVIDNFEQVVPAAPILTGLLSATPQLKMLVTSREVLHLYGEHDFPLLPMALPRAEAAVESLLSYDSVRLFVERASSVRPGFRLTSENARLVSEVCTRLDGLPLAIELAAGHVRTLPLDSLASRLEKRLDLLSGGPRDLPARQQALRTAIDWSYDLLDAEEGAAFRLLSVFSGGCTLDAIAAVHAALHPAPPASPMPLGATLASLADKSLLRHTSPEDDTRYFMLETIRDYAWEKLSERGDGRAALEAHLLYYLSLAEEAEPQLKGPHGVEWLARIERDHDNIRAALDRAAAHNPALGVRLAAGMGRFWEMRGHLSEGRSWLTRALATRQGGASADRAKALSYAGRLAWRQGDSLVAEELSQQALAIYSDLGDKSGSAMALHILGVVALGHGDYSAARARYEQSLAIRRDLGDNEGIAALLGNLGLVAYSQGDYPAARALYNESLDILRALGDRWSISIRLHNLAGVSFTQGDYHLAGDLYRESLEIARELGDRDGVAASLCNLGWVSHQQGDYLAARPLFEQGLTIARELGARATIAETLIGMGQMTLRQGDPQAAGDILRDALDVARELEDKAIIASALHSLGLVRHATGDLSDARTFYAQSLEIRREITDRRGVAGLFNDIARLELAESQPGRAALLFAAADALFAAIGFHWEARERAALDTEIETARTLLGDEAFSRAWAQGRSMPFDEVAARALDMSPA